MTTAITVPFHGADLFIVEYQGQPYTPMKPIVEGMGLDWASQFTKLKNNAGRWGIVMITIPTLGDLQEMICMPLRKLAGWLMTIQPSRVKPQIRDTILKYQNECDDVLWQYWTEGQVTRKAEPTEPLQLPYATKAQREPLIKAVRHLVSVANAKGRTLTYENAHNIINLKMGVDSVEALTVEQIPKAMTLVGEILERVVLEGEYLGKDEEIPHQFDEDFITAKQRQELEQAVTYALLPVKHDCGDSGRQWAHNRLRVRLNLRCMEEMRAEQFPLALAELKQLEKDLRSYLEFRTLLHTFLCQRIIGAGTPWTNDTARKWKLMMDRKVLPICPDWLLMKKQLLN
jgi:hypothetical protein